MPSRQFTLATAFCLCVPVLLFTVQSYGITPAFALAPFVAWSLLRDIRGGASIAFVVSALAGLASIVVAEFVIPDGEVLRHILSLTLLMFSASFAFLGRWQGETVGIKEIVGWFGLLSSLFVIALAMRLVLSGQPFRIADLENNTLLNAKLFGLDVFGAFGVNSLAHLFCIQVTLIAGALFGRVTPIRWTTPVLLLGVASASYLIWESSARSSQLYLLAVFVLVAGMMLRRMISRSPFLGAALAAVIIVAAAGALVAGSSRLMDTFQAIQGQEQVAALKPGDPGFVERPPERISENFVRLEGGYSYAFGDVTNGRANLIWHALAEFRASPIFGSGFGSYGRVLDTTDPNLRINSSTHLYYLTVLWKGGLLFAVPFFLFIGILWWTALSHRRFMSSVEGIAAASAVALTFGWLALTWDILYVPSAGALAWYLLGALGSTDQS